MSDAWQADPDVPLQLRADRVMWREVNGEVVALELDRWEYLSVNRAATALWGLLADGATPRQLARVLAERWQLDDQQAERDVEAFLRQLASAGLLAA